SVVGMDCLVDTSISLRAADHPQPATTLARKAMKLLLRQGNRLCVAKQSLIEAWVVATRPRDVNGFGYSAPFAMEGLAKLKRIFNLLVDTDDIYAEWERLVFANRVLGKEAYDARLVATMKVHRITDILTFDTRDFNIYEVIQMLHPNDVLSPKP